MSDVERVSASGAAAGAGQGVGARMPRKEDDRFMRGRGQYVADIRLAGLQDVAFVRSPLPHARIVSIDASAARALDGVAAVYTGEDIAAKTSGITPMVAPDGYQCEPIFALAIDKVRFVGDPVAIVVAESRYVRASLLTLAPPPKPGALELRTLNASNPTPVPMRPACERP